jgi:broad specificity phosphatase PhoE
MAGMSTLYLVRHGQASFGQSNYDRLSELGERQSRLLGEYWLRWSVSLDAVYTGTLERQRASAQAAAEVYRAAGRPFPALVAVPGFNEYDSSALLTGSVPQVLARHPEIAALLKEIAPTGQPDLAGNKKNFQRVFSRVMTLWVEGKITVAGMESWPDFTGRVNRGLDQLMAEHGAGKTVAVFTSGGPISAAMQRALGTSDRVALDLGWMIVNSSITEFRWSMDRFSLVSFNTTPHLSETSLISYR